MIQLFIPSIRELNEKYGYDVFAKMLTEHIKEYPRKNKQQIRLSGKSMKVFSEHYNKLSDIEKQRFVHFKYHAIPKNITFPCSEWKWVLDVTYYNKGCHN